MKLQYVASIIVVLCTTSTFSRSKVPTLRRKTLKPYLTRPTQPWFTRQILLTTLTPPVERTKPTPSTKLLKTTTTTTTTTTTATTTTPTITKDKRTTPTTTETLTAITTPITTTTPKPSTATTSTASPRTTRPATATTIPHETTTQTITKTPTPTTEALTTDDTFGPSIPLIVRKIIDYQIKMVSKENNLPFKSLSEVFSALKTYNSANYEAIATVDHVTCPRLFEKPIMNSLRKIQQFIEKQQRSQIFKKTKDQVCYKNDNGNENKIDCELCCHAASYSFSEKALPNYCKFCVCRKDVVEGLSTTVTTTRKTTPTTSTKKKSKTSKNKTSGESGLSSSKNSATSFSQQQQQQQQETTEPRMPSRGDERTSEGETSPRKRRSTTSDMTDDELAVLQQLGLNGTAGITAKLRGSCPERGSVAHDRGTYNMCHSCAYLVQLSSDYYPQSFIHTTCGKGVDTTCFTTEGKCVKMVVQKPFLKWKFDPSTGQTTGHEELAIPVTLGCSCEILHGSILQMFV